MLQNRGVEVMCFAVCISLWMRKADRGPFQQAVACIAY